MDLLEREQITLNGALHAEVAICRNRRPVYLREV